MTLNIVRLYKIRKLVDLIFHDSNNAAFSVGIRACFHAAFVGITHHANPERMPMSHRTHTTKAPRARSILDACTSSPAAIDTYEGAAAARRRSSV
jgi:hypothetical protein